MSTDVLSRAAIGMAVRAFREAAHLSSAELADACQMHPSLMSRTESGQRDLMLHEAVEVCRATGVDIDRFIRVCNALHKDGSAESWLATKKALADIGRNAVDRTMGEAAEPATLTLRDIQVTVNPKMKPGTAALVQGGKVVAVLKTVGCGCEPMGLDGEKCPGPDGKLLCQ